MLHRLLRRFHRTTFRNKLVMTYILIIVIPVISALIFSGMQLYKQTNSDYEGILQQLNHRTNVTIDDFFTSLARSSFFYLTEPRLNDIMNKSKPASGKQYIADANYMQSSMEQFVLINSNIAMISVLAPNGSIYGSKPEKAVEIVQTINSIGRERLKNTHFAVTVSPETAKRTNHRISIVRYLSDLNLRNGREGYAKIDIYDRAFENMLGGISDDEPKLGTLVLSGNRILYNSDARFNEIKVQEMERLTSNFTQITNGSKRTLQLKYKDQLYLFSGSVNKVTGWTIIQFIPVHHIFDTFVNNTLNYVFFSLLSLIAALALAFFFHRYFIQPILNLCKSMKTMDTVQLSNVIPGSDREDEIGRLINSFNDMILRLKASRESEIASSELQKKAELKMLQSQINPHFLYNTLNAIHSISELHRLDQISVMTKSLASIYRYNIKYGDEVTIEKELEQIENYIKIQQIRFPNKFEVQYDVSPDVLHCKILKFLIQPIIENSFYHGLEPKGGQGLLKLTIGQRGQLLYICVCDNGVGIKEEKLKELTAMLQQNKHTPEEDTGRNFGLRNVHARIKHFYGNDCRMEITSNDQEGTSISIHLPINREMSSDENFGGR